MTVHAIFLFQTTSVKPSIFDDGLLGFSERAFRRKQDFTDIVFWPAIMFSSQINVHTICL